MPNCGARRPRRRTCCAAAFSSAPSAGDQGTIDRFGPDGLSAVVASGAMVAKRFQTGLVYSYALVMLIGVAAFATWFMVR